MNSAPLPVRKALIVAPGQGRIYSMGRMRAVFFADNAETDSRYSISEWWLEPNTEGPGVHAHPEDHIFYVIEGTVSIVIDSEWSHAAQGSHALISGGTPHTFENRQNQRCGFLSINIPGGFELMMPRIVEYVATKPFGDVGIK